MVEAVYPTLLERSERGTLTEREVRDIVAVVADGYAFPTNLDSDPPLGGNAPETGQDLVRRAVEEIRQKLLSKEPSNAPPNGVEVSVWLP